MNVNRKIGDYYHGEEVIILNNAYSKDGLDKNQLVKVLVHNPINDLYTVDFNGSMPVVMGIDIKSSPASLELRKKMEEEAKKKVNAEFFQVVTDEDVKDIEDPRLPEFRNDKIKHPKHYTQGIECWDYIVSHDMGYLDGNIIKYVTRYKHKNGVEDLEKAKAYLEKLIKIHSDKSGKKWYNKLFGGK